MEDLEEINKKIDITEYNHQGAAIIRLEEFDLAILTEEDERVEGTEEDKKEEPVEIPPELNVYNCGACTLENPMTNERCAVCDTPRPPDAGMNLGGDNADNNEEIEEVDPMTQINEKYANAIKNRIKGMEEEFKQISKEVELRDKEDFEMRKKEIENLTQKFENMKKEAAKHSNSQNNKDETVKNENDKDESMNLGKLFNEQADYEENAEIKEDVKNEEGEKDQKEQEDQKPAENQEQKSTEDQKDTQEDVVKIEDSKEEAPPEEKKIGKFHHLFILLSI